MNVTYFQKYRVKLRRYKYFGHLLRHDRYYLLQIIMIGKKAGKEALE